MDFMSPNSDGIFRDDIVSFHLDTIVFDWFEEHSGQFQRMILPPRSADMSPSNIYGILPEVRSCRKFWTGNPFKIMDGYRARMGNPLDSKMFNHGQGKRTTP
ncbi:hypothetical protein TNCV_2929271 [Trichonephila clavipes]|nr:hypothetical protein TNCV_2929271 [Trichonephila clavipes]